MGNREEELRKELRALKIKKELKKIKSFKKRRAKAVVKARAEAPKRPASVNEVMANIDASIKQFSDM